MAGFEPVTVSVERPIKSVLLVYPVAEFSIWDVARGLDAGLRAQGIEVRHYYMNKRWAYHATAINAGWTVDVNTASDAEIANRNRWISRQASESVVLETMYDGGVDAVIFVCGLSVHPVALALLHKLRPDLPVGIVFTESPYEDPDQVEWASAHPHAVVFTNDKVSAAAHDGWIYLPHALDPAIHRPMPPDPEFPECDVLFLGSGWHERRVLFEAVNWDGINFQCWGIWANSIPDDAPIRKHLVNRGVDNAQIAGVYARAKIVLNYHRVHDTAYSLNPRVREVAGCRAFQLTDYRPELHDVFGTAIDTFDGPAELETKVRRYLADPAARHASIDAAYRAVMRPSEWFTERAATVVGALAARRAGARQLHPV